MISPIFYTFNVFLSERFGMFYVNFTSPFKERIPKKSVGFVKDLTKNRYIEDYEKF